MLSFNLKNFWKFNIEVFIHHKENHRKYSFGELSRTGNVFGTWLTMSELM